MKTDKPGGIVLIPRQIAQPHTRRLIYYGVMFFLLLVAAPESVALPAVNHPNTSHFILLNAGIIDTSNPQIQRAETPPGAFVGRRMWLIQFAGAIQPEWYAALQQTGVQIIGPVPQSAYLVYGTSEQLARLAQLATSEPYIQWYGPFRGQDRIFPTLQNNQTSHVIIQLIDDPPANAATFALLGITDSNKLQHAQQYINLEVELPAGTLSKVASRPDVISIQPYETPERHDESQDQIVAGNISGNSPNPGDYLAWLASKGFTQAQFDTSGFVVDVADSGIDNGTTLPNHFALYPNGIIGSTSRVAYSRLIGTPTGPTSTLEGLDGHGTLNAHIIAGDVPSGPPYNAFPHADANGFRYGLGVAPFVRVGASVIFDNGASNDYTNPDFEDLMSLAYQDGARISSNSWGSASSGIYTADAQRYDALVRDAQPSNAIVALPGNQEMVTIFSAGNYGPFSRSLGSPGTAKNVMTVGASEGVRAIGGSDRCNHPDSDADSLNDMASFSSRGPTTDGRVKPDLVAPGTHITGGVWQDPNPSANGSSSFNGSGICGGLGESFFPSGQQWYSASSGTSHSAPAVAGAAALLRQDFINHRLRPPSPAMTKAILMNNARYLTGTDANDTLPSFSQGMGLLDLGRTFDATPRLLRDQEPVNTFSASGQQCIFVGSIVDPTQPLRITLAWTDAPGTTIGAAYVNNLDLRATIGGITYLGNVFSGAYSIASGASDAQNNVESIILPAGLPAGTAIVISITATNLTGDGIPNQGGPLDQDFALVVSNIHSYTTILPLVVR